MDCHHGIKLSNRYVAVFHYNLTKKSTNTEFKVIFGIESVIETLQSVARANE